MSAQTESMTARGSNSLVALEASSRFIGAACTPRNAKAKAVTALKNIVKEINGSTWLEGSRRWDEGGSHWCSTARVIVYAVRAGSSATK